MGNDLLRRGVTQRITIVFCLFMAISLMPAIQPRAQTAATGNVLQQFEQAFEHMLLDPANLDKSFKYAELGIQVGDYEAAISALERMLLYNPDWSLASYICGWAPMPSPADI